MKKPPTISGQANIGQAKKLNTGFYAATVTLTRKDFNAVWKLAKEAMHTNEATSFPDDCRPEE